MNSSREDVICPACPDPDTAFRIEDVGMKIATDGDYLTGNRMTFTVSRPAWEPVMLAHLRAEDDDEHQRLYDLCVTELIAAEKTAEDVARDDVESVVGWHQRWLNDAVRRRGAGEAIAAINRWRTSQLDRDYEDDNLLASAEAVRQAATATRRVYPPVTWYPPIPDPRDFLRRITVT